MTMSDGLSARVRHALLTWSFVCAVSAGCAGTYDARLAALPPKMQVDIGYCTGHASSVRRSYGALAFTDNADRYAGRDFENCMKRLGYKRKDEPNMPSPTFWDDPEPRAYGAAR